MPHHPDTAKDILSLGGNLSIEDSKYTPETMRELAKLAKTHNAHLTVKGAGQHPDTLKDLVKLAGKNVTIIV